jgi:hypothetical protein
MTEVTEHEAPAPLGALARSLVLRWHAITLL